MNILNAKEVLHIVDPEDDTKMIDHPEPHYLLPDGVTRATVEINGVTKDYDPKGVRGPQLLNGNNITTERQDESDKNWPGWQHNIEKKQAEEKKRKEEYESFKKSLVYEDRLIAFLDILGWGDAINKSITDPKLTEKLGMTLNGISQFKNFLQSRSAIGHEDPVDTQLSQFSDCLVLSVKVNGSIETTITFMNNFEALIYNILATGYFPRGGITYGKLIHRESFVYGPGLVRAYKLENKIAKFPRIILEESIGKIWEEGNVYYDTDKKTVIGTDRKWKKDNDGWSYYDYLKPPFYNPHIDYNINQFKSYIIPIKERIIDNLKIYSNKVDIYEKYVWLAEKYNSICDEYVESDLEKIKL